MSPKGRKSKKAFPVQGSDPRCYYGCMGIYVSHSTNFDYKTKLYEPLRANFADHDIFLPHEKNEEAVDTKQIIKTTDLILAEVSHPSTGQGIELGWANDSGVPIVCIHRDESTPSNALRVVSNEFISYSSAEDLVEKLRKFIWYAKYSLVGYFCDQEPKRLDWAPVNPKRYDRW